MITEQNFLVRYGLHNFISCTQINGRITFLIRGIVSQKLICHAEHLITEAFGDLMEIQHV